MELQISLVEELQLLDTRDDLQSLFGVAVEVLTLVSLYPSDIANERVSLLLKLGVSMLNSPEDEAPDVDDVEAFIYVAGYCSCNLGAALPDFTSTLIKALLCRPNYRALLLEYIRNTAEQLGARSEVGRPRNSGVVAYTTLSKMFISLVRDPQLHHCEDNIKVAL